MKSSVISQMFNCQRGNYNNIPMNEKYFELLDVVIASENKLKNELSKYPELKKLFDKYNCDLTEHNMNIEECFFVEAFKFGFLMGQETMADI